jgi:hypothetical protein
MAFEQQRVRQRDAVIGADLNEAALGGGIPEERLVDVEVLAVLRVGLHGLNIRSRRRLRRQFAFAQSRI